MLKGIIFNQQYYTYSPDNPDTFYLDGKVITNDKEVKQLQYIRRILDGDLTPTTKNGVWEYYILSTGEHPEAVKVNRNTKEVREATEQQAKELIKKIEGEKAKELREEKAQEDMRRASEESQTDMDDVSLSDDGLEIDEATGEFVQKAIQSVDNTKESTKETPAKDIVSDDNSHASMENPDSKEHKPDTQSFKKLIGNKDYRGRVMKVIRSKWKEASSIPEMEKLLRSKNIEVDNIGTSKEDIESWIKTIEDCR